MATIGLFYGTDTGNTERIAKRIKELLEQAGQTVDLHEIYKKTKDDMAKYNLLVLGMPTWYDGELQGDWEAYMDEMKQIDFTGKKVAFFGLGDQYGYASYFCDALGVFAKIVEDNNGQLVGFWPVAGYEHDFSKAQRGDYFVGLCLDVDNQDNLTEERVQGWVKQILREMKLTSESAS
ncbi:MAG: flavodoxin [Chitinophagales bacterium]|nr:flavodoxin [Chitinophagales bacterium]MDW8418027.1 flavodoxin [Chitinophagales bacterium]